MTKALVPNANNTGLGTLARVRLEMGKIYRQAKSGKLDPMTASRLVYILKEIRCCLEAEILERLETRVDAATQEAIQRATERRSESNGTHLQ
jgi:hypothetical protein